MDIIRTQSLLKYHAGYGFTLGHIDLQVRAGEIVGIMGPRNAGKTTLLKILWGFVRPTSGSVAVFGMTPHLHQIDIRLRAGYVSGRSGFYEWMTARCFLEFISHFYPNWDQSRAEALLDDFDIHGETKVQGLSSGDRLKLSLIAALGHRPDLLFLDEPMREQEPGVWADIHAFLKLASGEHKVSVLISSEVSGSLDRLADTVLMLNQGAVVHCAQIADLIKQFGTSRLEDIFVESAGKISKNSRRTNA